MNIGEGKDFWVAERIKRDDKCKTLTLSVMVQS